jgi:hypothetical protein
MTTYVDGEIRIVNGTITLNKTNMTNYVDTSIGTVNGTITTNKTDMTNYVDGEILTVNGTITTNKTDMTNYVDGEILTVNGTITTNKTDMTNYVDGEILTVNGTITLNKTNMTNYVDTSIGTVNGTITTNKTNMTNYVDTSIGTVNGTITTNKTNMTNYVDTSIGTVNGTITTNKTNMTNYVDTSIGTVNGTITTNKTNMTNYVDTSIGTVNETITTNKTNMTNYVDSSITNILSTENVFTENQTMKESQLIFDKTTKGLRFEVYENFHGDVALYSNNATKLNISGYSDNFDNLNASTNELLSNRQNDFSVEWIGQFFASETGSYRFSTLSDDGSYLWIGESIENGITTGNALVKNGGVHGSEIKNGNINLVKNPFYPIRILYGQGANSKVMRMRFEFPILPFRFSYGVGFLFSSNVEVVDILCTDRLKIGFQNNDTSINIDKDGLSLGNETLTEELLGFLTPVTSNIQE